MSLHVGYRHKLSKETAVKISSVVVTGLVFTAPLGCQRHYVFDLSVCLCVRLRTCVRTAEAFSGRLAVDLYTVRQKKGTNFVLCASFST